MNLSRVLPRVSLLTFAGALSGLAIGCVIGGGIDGKKECGAVGSHSELDESVDPPECRCDTGYDWCNPDVDDDFSCCTPDIECEDPNSHVEFGQCACDSGYEWCNPDDPEDLSCCEIPGGTGTDGGDGDDDGGDTGGGCGEPDPLPSDCGPDDVFCDSADENCPGSFYTCVDGEWVLDTETGDAWCMPEDDFSYGCYDDETDMTIYFLCDKGPGSDCTGDTVECVDADTISECKFGKLAQDSCLRICQEEGDAMGAQYDFGECGEQGGSIECLCCDFDDADCGGGTGTSGDGSGTGTGTGTGTSG